MYGNVIRITAVTACLTCGVLLGQPSSCPPQGLQLGAAGGRLGDAWNISLLGAPLAPGALAFDVSPGPIASPIGTLCLGLTPALQLLPFSLDGSGFTSFGGLLPPIPALAGATVYMQAIDVDATQPSGFGLSNDRAITLVQPRLFFINPGLATPFGTTPGAFSALSTLTDTVPFSQPLASSVRDVVYVREQNLLLMLLGNGNVAGFDGISGALVFSTPLPPAAQGASYLAVAPGGASVLMLAPGFPPNPFSGGTPAVVHVFSPTTQTVTSSIMLTLGGPDAILASDASALAFVRYANSIVPVDYAIGAALPAIPLPTTFGALTDWKLEGTTIFGLLSGAPAGLFSPAKPAALVAVDVLTQTVTATAALTMTPPATFLRAGPGTTGPSLYVYGDAAATLFEFNQSALAFAGAAATGSGVTSMELSALGYEWLLFCNGGACGGPALLSMPAGTLGVLTVTPLPPGFQPNVWVSPSASIGKAYLVLGTNLAAPVFTDPATAPASTVALPTASGAFRVVSN